MMTLEEHMASFDFPSGHAQFFSVYTGFKTYTYTYMHIGMKFV